MLAVGWKAGYLDQDILLVWPKQETCGIYAESLENASYTGYTMLNTISEEMVNRRSYVIRMVPASTVVQKL